MDLSRQLYNTPKQLVEQGLVSAVKQRTGRRQRTVYSINASGRAALRRWLSTEAKPPSLEFEPMVHVLLPDQGSLEDLQKTLQRVIEQAKQARELSESHKEFTDATEGGTFPERQHLFVLSSAFMIGHFAHMAAWASWALGEVRTWQDSTGRP